MTYRGHWTKTATATLTAPPRSARPRRSLFRLAGALGVERCSLERTLSLAHYNLTALRSLTLTDLSAPPLRSGDAERIFYLVQWERLQAHLETHGELPETAELTPLLVTLTPIFERHFNRGAPSNTRLNETLLARYRAVVGVGPDATLSAQPGSRERFSGGFLPYFYRTVYSVLCPD